MSVPAVRGAAGWLLLLFAVGLAVRLVYLVAVLGLSSPLPHAYDDGIYDDLGRAIAAGEGMSHQGRPTAIVSAGYPYFIGGCYALLGPGPEGPRLIQAVLGALSACLIAAIGLELGLGLLSAVLAGLLAAVYPSSVYFTGRYFPMVVHLFLLLVAILALLRWRRGGWAWPLLAGVALGAGALVRADVLMLIPLLALAAVALGGGLRRGLAGAALLGGVALLMQLPWLLRNQERLGAPILTTTFAWRTLWVGNNPWARGGYVLANDVLDRYAVPGSERALPATARAQLEYLRGWWAHDKVFTEVQAESAFAHMVTTWRRAEPGLYLANTGRKLLAFVNPWPGQGGDVLRRYAPLLAACVALWLPLAAWGFLAARGLGAARWPFLAVLAQALFTALVVFGHPRFRFTAEMVLMPFAGHGLALAWRRWRGRRARASAAAG